MATAIEQSRLRRAVGRLTECLARRDYVGLCGSVSQSRLSPQELDTAVRDYGRTIIPLPTEAYSLLNVLEVTHVTPQRWSVVVPLWTKEEGRSDLSLEITIEDVAGEDYAVEIDDLHVL
jgi:hypothetical protein